MFNNLTDLGYKRSKSEAIGFYVAYLLILVFAVVIVGVIYNLLMRSADYQAGINFGIVFAGFASLALSFLILHKKYLLGNYGYILLALLSGALGLFGGVLLGLIPAAYLTTKAKKEEGSAAENPEEKIGSKP